MSSMLKKKKGLNFKPKAKPPRAVEPPSTSASQTPAITEPPSQSQSQASTPAPPSATATAPTVSTPSASSNGNATPTIQPPPKEKEKEPVPNTCPVVPSITTTKPHEPATAASAPTPDPTNTPPTTAPETIAKPTPAPRDQPTEPTITPPPGKPNASIPSKPAAPATVDKQQTGSVQSAVSVPTPSYPRITPAVTSRDGLLATPAPDGLVTPASTQPQATTDRAAPPVVAEAAPSSQVTAPRRNLPSPPTLPITETIAATAAPAEAGPSTAEPKKKRQYRKRKAPAEVEGGENGEASASAAPKPKRQRKKKAAPEEGAENGDGTPAAASKPRRPRQSKAAQAAENGDAAEAEAASEEGPIGAAAPKGFRRKRQEPTPEDAENQQIDHTVTKMADITRDLGIGKKFKHADAILERQREARRNAQMRRLERKQRAKGLLPDVPEGSEDGAGAAAGGGDGAEGGTPAPEAAEAVAPMDGGGVEYDIIDGQIVVNQSSLTVNQHAGQDFTSLETVEEDEFTNLTTSASYLRANKAAMGGTNHWSDEDTERFYHYLKMFGTDFETISHVFPGKSRRHIKLKFNREEKARPKRINAAIMARGAKKVAIDLEDFKSQWRGEEWQEPDNIRADQARVAAEYEEHLEELRQQRRELGLLDDEEPAAADAAAAEGEEGAVEGEGAAPASVPVAAGA
ncbi:myb-like dna-binding domain-containing protein [Apiospora rasikravindrae]|uniref:Myb-like dna-binding domain-containing protein n=1 Tax=Apiospora rasikravindrae TaxID=990691 RepID=A0ABR1T5Q0_9PEZI